MKIISLINRKGGVGKSAVAIALAVASQRNNIDTIVIDTDEQASVYKWSQRRESEMPIVVSSQPVQVTEYLDRARENGAGLAIIDTAGLATQSSLEFARLSDLVVIPTGPSVRDIEALSTAIDIANMAKKKHLIVMNKLHPNSMRKFDEIRKHLENVYGASVFPSYISLRQSHQDSDLDGLAAQELDPEKAGREIEILYNGIARMIGSYQPSDVSNNQVESAEL